MTTNNIVTLHNAFTILSLSSDPTNESDNKQHVIVQISKLAQAIVDNKQERQRQQDQCKHVKNTLQRLQESEELIFDENTTQAEDERRAMAKDNTSNAKRKAITAAHKFDTKDTGIIQNRQNVMHSIGLALKQTVKRVTGTKQVRFSRNTQIRLILSRHKAEEIISVIYNSGADGHYITKADCIQAQLPILHNASKKVAVANSET